MEISVSEFLGLVSIGLSCGLSLGFLSRMVFRSLGSMYSILRSSLNS